jgi:hypothetical protein
MDNWALLIIGENVVNLPRRRCRKAFCHSVLSRVGLFKLRSKAIRSGAWFRTLRRIDRALIDLTLEVADRIRSKTLGKTLLTLVARRECALVNQVSCSVNGIGFVLARKLAVLGQKLGNPSALAWATSITFARFLAMMHGNHCRCLKP